MTPLATNPSLPQVKTLALTAPFRGVYRRNSLPQPEGNLWYLHRCGLKEPALSALPGYNGDPQTMTRMGWSSSEHTRGVINQPSGSGFYVLTEDRLHGYDFSADPDSQFSMGNGTSPGVGGVKDMWIFAGATLVGLAHGSKLLADGNYYTVDYVESDTHVWTIEDQAPFVNQPVTGFNTNFVGDIQAWYGPRYCWFGTKLILCGLYGVYHYDPLVDAHIKSYQRSHRGMDIINFAGRPVLLGAVEASDEYDPTPIPGLLSDKLTWPTRSDYTDYTSYGSGFLHLHTDGSGIRCGVAWGEDAYAFTGTSIYQLIETGMSASNPIAFQKHPTRLLEQPLSNAVAGIRGIYFWTEQGPVMFDGVQLHDLSLSLELDLGSRTSSIIHGGVHVWADAYTRTIRFHNYNLQTPVLQYIFWEDTQQWTTLDEDSMYLAGTGKFAGDIYGVRSTPIVTDTVVSVEQDEEQGTEDLLEVDFVTRATWRGITMPEGPHVNKILQQIRVLVEQYNTGNLVLSMVPDVAPDTIPDANKDTISITGSESVQWVIFDVKWELEDAVWRLDIHFLPRTKIHQVLIDYTVGGDTNL